MTLLLRLLFSTLLVGMATAAALHDGVHFFSIQMTEAVKMYSAPKLPDLVKSLGLNVLYDSIVNASLVDALSAKGPYTVLAPTDAAFAALPDWEKKAVSNVSILTAILKYHVLSGKVLSSDIKNELLAPTLEGKEVRFNIYPNSVVTAQCSPIDLNNVDKLASNGVLHEISRVMLPPAGTVVDAIAACPVLQDLKLAVAVAGLDAALREEGPFTVFAPTDTAFEQLPPGALDNLLKNKTALTEVLLYHVVKNTYCSAGLSSVSALTTLGGKDLAISVAEGHGAMLQIGSSPRGLDGNAHEISRVVVPPPGTIVDALTASTIFRKLVAAAVHAPCLRKHYGTLSRSPTADWCDRAPMAAPPRACCTPSPKFSCRSISPPPWKLPAG